jgi:hypothetical protein
MSAAAVGTKVREIGVFNTTNTATDVKLIRVTADGTGTSLTNINKYDPDSAAAGATPKHSYTADVTAAAGDLGYRASIGAGIGAGIIWTFGDSGLRQIVGTGNGLALVRADAATVTTLQCYIVWDE